MKRICVPDLMDLLCFVFFLLVPFPETMASRDELHEKEVVKNPQKLPGEKNNHMGEFSVVLPRVVRFYIMDSDAIDSSSDDEENHQGEKSK